MLKDRKFVRTYALVGVSFLISLAFTASGFIFNRPFLALFILLGIISAVIFVWATRVWVQKKQTPKQVLLSLMAIVLAPAFGVAFTLYVPPVLGIPTNALGAASTHPPPTPSLVEDEQFAELDLAISLLEQRCEAVATSALQPKNSTLSEVFGDVESIYLPAQIQGGGNNHIEDLGNGSILLANSHRSNLGAIYSNVYLLDDASPQPKKITSLPGHAILDLLVDNTRNKLYYSFVSRADGCLHLGLASVPLVDGTPVFNKVDTIFRTSPCLEAFPDWGDSALSQNGGRIGLSRQGTVLITVGDFRLGASSLSEQINIPASRDSLTAPLGYGGIYDVNPETSVSRKVSFGHRNPQGMAIDLNAGHAWVNEHGPQGGDEINLVPLDSDSANYGYVEQTLGNPYGGWDFLKTDRDFAKTYLEKVGVEGLNRWCQDDAFGDKVSPVALIGPDSGYAPSQLLILKRSVSSGLQIPVRTMLMATLANQALWAFDVQGTTISNPRRIPLGERIRDLVQSSDGSLYLSFDSGSIMKVSSSQK